MCIMSTTRGINGLQLKKLLITYKLDSKQNIDRTLKNIADVKQILTIKVFNCEINNNHISEL